MTGRGPRDGSKCRGCAMNINPTEGKGLVVGTLLVPISADKKNNRHKNRPFSLFSWAFSGAGDGTRTRDNLLGRQTLYQLSYPRKGPDRAVKSGWRDSNPRPQRPKRRALPTALHPGDALPERKYSQAPRRNQTLPPLTGSISPGRPWSSPSGMRPPALFPPSDRTPPIRPETRTDRRRRASSARHPPR